VIADLPTLEAEPIRSMIEFDCFRPGSVERLPSGPHRYPTDAIRSSEAAVESYRQMQAEREIDARPL
jgi:hypothetical protein